MFPLSLPNPNHSAAAPPRLAKVQPYILTTGQGPLKGVFSSRLRFIGEFRAGEDCATGMRSCTAIGGIGSIDASSRILQPQCPESPQERALHIGFRFSTEHHLCSRGRTIRRTRNTLLPFRSTPEECVAPRQELCQCRTALGAPPSNRHLRRVLPAELRLSVDLVP
jgi:hypothetical protein